MGGLLSLEILDCKWYSGDTVNTAITRTVSTCDVCKKRFLNWTNATSTAQCHTRGLSGCETIKGCDTIVCYKDNAGTVTSACRMCNKGYYGVDFEATNNTGSKKCTKGVGIGNCDMTRQT